MKNIKKIIYIVVLVITLIGAVLVFTNETSKKRLNEIKNEVVVLKEPKVLPENDGKLVLVTGRVTAKEKELKDKDFGINVKTPYLKRQVDRYELKTVKKGRYVFKWDNVDRQGVSTVTDIDENDKNTYKNPGQFILDNEYLGAANIGDFTISKDRIKPIGTNAKYSDFKESDLKDIDWAKQIYQIDGKYDELDRKGLKQSVINNKTYIKEIATKEQFDKNNNFLGKIGISNKRFIETVKFHKNDEYIVSYDRIPIRGDLRISYDYLDLDKKVEISILAKQEGKDLKPYKLDSADPIYQTYTKKITSKDALIKKLESEGDDAKLGVVIVLVIVIIVGFFVFRKKPEVTKLDEEDEKLLDEIDEKNKVINIICLYLWLKEKINKRKKDKSKRLCHIWHSRRRGMDV